MILQGSGDVHVCGYKIVCLHEWVHGDHVYMGARRARALLISIPVSREVGDGCHPERLIMAEGWSWRGAGGAVNAAELREMGPLRAFLQTLLPWIDVAAAQPLPEGAPDGPAQENAFDAVLQDFLVEVAQAEIFDEEDLPPPPDVD